MINTIPYTLMVEQLDAFALWINENLNINLRKRSRFFQLVENVRLINQSYQDNTLESLIQEKGNDILWYSLIDAGTFIEIHNFFKNVSNVDILPKDKIKASLKGPFFSKDEIKNSQNIYPRNCLFELQSAAFFNKRGATIIGFDDVQFQYDGQIFNVECKRVFTEKKVGANVRKAHKKLPTETPVNFISISLEKILSTDERMIICADEDELPIIIRGLVSKFIESHKHKWRRLYTNGGIIGLILAVPCAVHILNLQLLVNGWEWHILPLVDPNKRSQCIF